MATKLFDSERKVMEVLWEADAPLTAKEVAQKLGETVGWNKNTTYTVIKKCIDKGAIQRREPNFQCFPLIRREEVQTAAAVELVDKVFDDFVVHVHCDSFPLPNAGKKKGRNILQNTCGRYRV